MNTQIRDRLDQLLNNINELPSIPTVAAKVVSMVNNPEMPLNKIAEEISKDQAITTNVLKLCNSAYFSRGKEISSIERAVVTLGIKEVMDIVIIAATKSIMEKPLMGYDLAKGDLWRQGLAVAVMAKKIALMKNMKSVADIAFTGGIIHAIGKTIIAFYVQSTFNEILNLVTTQGMQFQAAEKEVMGYDHQEIGEKLLVKWGFPAVLKAIVRYYLEPDKAPEEFRPLVSIVHVANVLCLMGGLGIGSDGLCYEFNEVAVKTLGLKNNELEELYANLPDIIKQTQTLQ